MEDNGIIEDPVVTEDGIESQASVENPEAALQDRMAGDIEDSPWYSPSEGKVVDKDGKVIVDPNTKQPYKSLDEYNKAQATATPKKEESKELPKPAPMSRSFDGMVGELTPERIVELSKAGGEYKYKDELVPPIDPNAGAATPEENDPVEAVNKEREILFGHMVNPIKEISQLLINQGADKGLVDQLLAPVIAKQNEAINKHYEAMYQKALEEKLGRPIQQKLTESEQKALKVASEANIEKLARAYYPNGGKDQFFALVNGHYAPDGKTWVRGPSSEVLDLLVSVANSGKTFKTNEDRTASYLNTFQKLTANDASAKSLMNISHFYWLGRQAAGLQKMSFDKGKQSAQQQQQVRQRTVKTPPASYQAPSTQDEGMPGILKSVLERMGS
jgi:hypothetical protein